MLVVAIEEHHIIPEMSSSLGLNQLPPAMQARLHATVDERLADMDATRIDMQVLSVVLPMPEMLTAQTTLPLATRANDQSPASDQRVPYGQLVIEGRFEVLAPDGMR
jgi:hypothetical protein